MPHELVVTGEGVLTGKGTSSEWTEARRAALVDARGRASELAAAAGVRLGEHFRISEIAIRVTVTFQTQD
jgi:uncharacterized protein YggE